MRPIGWRRRRPNFGPRVFPWSPWRVICRVWNFRKRLRREPSASSAASMPSSISASQPTPPHGAYSPSKAALVMLVRQMAYEWGPDGIRCNCVSPGMTHTGMTDQVYSDPQRRAERASHIPLRRVGDPIDIARVVAFLISPDAGYVTGVDLPVDGGVQTALMPTLRGAAVPR
jgi:NAD(P)-dependent dehydrogenase (short-subunit alcohol dehydrogenase family)